MSRDSRLVLAGIIVSLISVIMGSVLLSQSAETLDKVAEHFDVEATSIWNPPIPDYEIPGYEGDVQANIAVGVASTFLVFAATLLVGRGLSRRIRAGAGETSALTEG
ncbi:hypothetical protein KEJ39_07790 [Candidatus Bathyarchaeota archaeon]|nr:hypothetical protein [Candidatus Bathyarchaeota archaeon]